MLKWIQFFWWSWVQSLSQAVKSMYCKFSGMDRIWNHKDKLIRDYPFSRMKTVYPHGLNKGASFKFWECYQQTRWGYPFNLMYNITIFKLKFFWWKIGKFNQVKVLKTNRFRHLIFLSVFFHLSLSHWHFYFTISRKEKWKLTCQYIYHQTGNTELCYLNNGNKNWVMEFEIGY